MSPHKTNDTNDPPPFPPGLHEAPIQRISLSSLLTSSPTSLSALTTACHTHGFFYLSLSGSPLGERLLSHATTINALMPSAFALPTHEKETCLIGSPAARGIFGFKKAGIIAKDDIHKRKDVGQMWNISKDDMLSQSLKPVPYPSIIQENRALFADFDKTAHEIGMHVLDILADSLAIPRGKLRERHRITTPSGDHSRLTYGPGDPSAMGNTGTSDAADTKITTYAHTDFGSVTLLFNWLGGLQISPSTTSPNNTAPEWQWVRPLPGHAICNLGDSMVIFSGRRLKSGRHRVVAAPGEQAKFDRYSLVYFVRPEDEVRLEDLTVEEGKAENEERDYTARQWIEKKARDLGNTVGKD